MIAKVIGILFCALAAGGGLMLAMNAAFDTKERSAWVAIGGFAAFIAGVVGMAAAGALL